MKMEQVKPKTTTTTTKHTRIFTLWIVGRTNETCEGVTLLYDMGTFNGLMTH